MHLARREVGALTRALQRCLPRRVARHLEEGRLKGELGGVAGRPGLADLVFGGVVEVVSLEAAAEGG